MALVFAGGWGAPVDRVVRARAPDERLAARARPVGRALQLQLAPAAHVAEGQPRLLLGVERAEVLRPHARAEDSVRLQVGDEVCVAVNVSVQLVNLPSERKHEV